MTKAAPALRAVLFDLDGTLVDTAPEIAAALNQLLISKQRPSLPFSHIRSVVSVGTNALVRLAFPEADSEIEFARLRDQLLQIYFETHLTNSKLFPGMECVLDTIESHGFAWGIVTNKLNWLTTPLVKALGLHQRTRCVVSGDTAARPKPFAEPLLYAADLLSLQPAQCVYVGDAETDMIAARAAHMRCLAAAYGYLEPMVRASTWDSDGILERPGDLCAWLSDPLLVNQP